MLTEAIHSLIAGEAVAPPIHARLRKALADTGDGEEVQQLATPRLGPSRIMAAVTLRASAGDARRDLARTVVEIERALKKTDARVAYVYVRPLV